MLEHIKANVSKQCDENEAVAKKLQDLLKSYEDKLKDLDEALKKANDSVKKANAQNGLNAQAMEDLKVHFPTTCPPVMTNTSSLVQRHSLRQSLLYNLINLLKAITVASVLPHNISTIIQYVDELK